MCPSRASSRVGFDGQLRASSPQASHPQPGTTALLRLRTPPLWTSGCTKQPVVAVGVGDPSMNAAPHGDATTKPLAQRVLEGTGEPRAGARLAGVCRVQPRQETGRASESRRSGPRTQPSHSGPRLQGPSTASRREIYTPTLTAATRATAGGGSHPVSSTGERRCTRGPRSGRPRSRTEEGRADAGHAADGL